MNDLANKYNIKMPSIGENIKKFRKEKGLTQKQLAEKCGMAEITIRQYETGKREPRLDQQKIISKALDIPLIYIISGTSDVISNALFIASIQDVLDMAESVGRDVNKTSELIELEIKLLFNYNKLNIEGKIKAVDHVEMLAKIPEYQKEETPDQNPEEE